MSLNLTFRMVEFTICFFLCVVCLPSAFCPNAFVFILIVLVLLLA